MGPWVARGSTPSRIYGMQRKDKEVIVAATGSCLYNSGANAHLIAAAPEMYKWLQVVIDSGEIDNLATHNTIVDLLEKARGEK